MIDGRGYALLMSESSEQFPPARARSRPPESDTPEPTESTELDVRDPGSDNAPADGVFDFADYLSCHEDRAAFGHLRERLGANLAPRDFVEQLWIDEIVIVEWEAHRLRSVKRSALERGMTSVLQQRWVQRHGIPTEDSDQRAYSEARPAVQGDVTATAILRLRLNDDPFNNLGLVAPGYLQEVNTQLDLERAIMACGERRDAIIGKLHARREFLDRLAARARAIPQR